MYNLLNPILRIVDLRKLLRRPLIQLVTAILSSFDPCYIFDEVPFLRLHSF